jgi:7,8-dihydro-6-hydroxymethylpterin-pyrophosphokinase
MPIHRAAIALGSNLGDSHPILKSALATLGNSSHITVEAVSEIYQTVAVTPARLPQRLRRAVYDARTPGIAGHDAGN